MNPITFIVEDVSFVLYSHQYKRSELLAELVTVTRESNIKIDHRTKEECIILYNYLTQGVTPSPEVIYVFEYFRVSPIDGYSLACLYEQDLRKNMYTQERECFKQPYYGLEYITEEIWQGIDFNRSTTENMLFTGVALKENNVPVDKASWMEIGERLEHLSLFIQEEGIMVAGGAIYSALFGLPFSDIDLFFYGMEEDEAENKIERIVRSLVGSEFVSDVMNEEGTRIGNPFHQVSGLEVIRTNNSITILTKPEIRIILRLYKTPSEALHGFDVDCCSLGLTKDGLFMTHRAWHALHNGYNTVNFDCLSHSYEYRLGKYGARAMRVRIPGFDKEKVNTELLEQDSAWRTNPQQERRHEDRGAVIINKGLDVLLELDHYCTRHNYDSWIMLTLNCWATGKSDYSTHNHLIPEGKPILSTLAKFVIYAKEHPEREYSSLGEFDYEILDYDYAVEQYKITYPEKEATEIELECFIAGYLANECLENKFDYIVNSLEEDAIFYTPYDDYDKECSALLFRTNTYKKLNYIHTKIINLPVLLHMPKKVFKILSSITYCEFGPNLTWKTRNPGEQVTNTFHRIVLEDNSEWYRGKYYRL